MCDGEKKIIQHLMDHIESWERGNEGIISQKYCVLWIGMDQSVKGLSVTEMGL